MRVEIDLFKGDLIAIKYFTDGRKEYFHGDIEVNEMLNNLYASEGKNLFELIANDTIVINKRVWTKYELLGNKSIIRRTVDEKKTVTRTKSEKPVVNKEEEVKPSVSPTPADTTETHVEPTPEVSEEHEEIKDISTPDGAIDVVVSDPTSEREERVKPRKGIKNLKRVSIAALAVVVGGYILVNGYNHLFKQHEDNKDNNDNHNDNHRYEETIEYPSVEPTVEPYNNGSVVNYDDMETQIDIINEACFNFQPCSLENLVVDSDREAIYTINNMRNKVLNNSCDADTFLNNIVNYIFENGTIFDGNVIKGYDSLTPYAQYIVLVASQSILQIDTNYEHTTTYSNYNFDVLVNSFDYMVNATYLRLVDNNKTR